MSREAQGGSARPASLQRWPLQTIMCRVYIVKTRALILAWCPTPRRRLDVQEGYVVQRPASRASWDDVRQHFLTCALDSHGCYSQFVAILRMEDGLPKLLTLPAFDALCDRMAAEREAGEPGPRDQTPCLLQVGAACRVQQRCVTGLIMAGIVQGSKANRQLLPHACWRQLKSNSRLFCWPPWHRLTWRPFWTCAL